MPEWMNESISRSQRGSGRDRGDSQKTHIRWRAQLWVESLHRWRLGWASPNGKDGSISGGPRPPHRQDLVQSRGILQ
jgi:hypothetical protein